MATIKDIQYNINIRSNVKNAEILFGSEFKGFSPNSFFTSLNEVRNNFNGRVEIKLVKIGYTSSTTYELGFEPNPEFSQLGGKLNQSSTDEETITNVSEFILVLNKFENGLEVESGELSNQKSYSLYFDLQPESKSSLLQRNILATPNRFSEILSNLRSNRESTPTNSGTFINTNRLSISSRFSNIGRFLPLTENLRNRIIPTPLQPVQNIISPVESVLIPGVPITPSIPTTTIIPQPVVTATQPIETITLPPVEEVIELRVADTTATLNVNLEGLIGSIKLVVNDSREIIVDSSTKNYTFNLGDKINILSTDISKFKLIQISVRGTTVNSLERVENTSQSINKQLIITESLIIAAKSEQIVIPTLELPSISFTNPSADRTYNINTQVPYPISITKNNTVDSLRVVIGNEVVDYRNLGSDSEFIILISETKLQNLGAYNISIIPRNFDGDGNAIYFTLNVVDDVWVGQPDIRNIRYPSRIQGPDFVGTDVEFELSWESINTDYVKITIPNGTSFIDAPATGRIKLNVNDILSLDGSEFSEDANTINIVLLLTPYNKSGRTVVTGRQEIINIKFSKGLLTIPRSVAVNRIVESFTSQLDTSILEIETSKYLTHALHLGDGENRLITTWTGSRFENEETLIVKLYEPLPTSVQPNQQVWISKYQSSPIILETVTLSSDSEEVCVPIKGPNFTIQPDNGVGFSVYDELIASGSETSNDLINRYTSKLGIDTSKLDIKYVDDDSYVFENFVNFGSAAERVNNFLYKVQLLQNYALRIEKLTTSPNDSILLSEDSLIITTESNQFIEFENNPTQFNTVADQLEATKIETNINSVIRTFDGFELFLYKNTTSTLSYPKELITDVNSGLSKYILLNSTSSQVTEWYDNLIENAIQFDTNNPNYVINNIPEFISDDENNKDFLLFFDMIGQHFDSVWVYINTLVKMKTTDESGVDGIPKKFVSDVLKSLGWNPRRAYDSQFLWEYVLGTDKDGNPKYSTSLEDANNQIWRRILNNLPYLLKHKGTARAMKAIMSCYGIPQSMLTIMEFGGPVDPTTNQSNKFTFEDRTAALKLKESAIVLVPWKQIPGTLEYPQSIEFMIKPEPMTASTEILSANGFELFITPTGSEYQLEFHIGGNITKSDTFILSTELYSNILINKTYVDATNSDYSILLKTSNGDTIIQSVEFTLQDLSSLWNSGTTIGIGNEFNGKLDEFRLWRIPLEESKFENHTLFPDAINGNSLSSSTDDLIFRLDFEYPKDRILDPYIKNVAINTIYGEPFATASNFYSADVYPYQYEPYERIVTATIPSMGYGYANKVRFEEQQLIKDLSHKSRSTLKSFDRAPIDSNRLGIFFSPIKELNLDILKAFGEFNIDNFIGDPKDQYRDSYKQLEKLREYYFERITLNVSEYIQLVKYINKSLFDVLETLAPARAKVSKGLLIEPHLLERSKVRWDKPTAESRLYDMIISIEDIEDISMNLATYNANFEYNQDTLFETTIPTYFVEIRENENYVVEAENVTYKGEINYSDEYVVNATIPNYHAFITYELRYKLLTEIETFGEFQSVGTNPTSMANLGYGLYAEDTTTIWKRYDTFGNYTQSRENVFLAETEVFKNIETQVSGYPRPEAQPGDPVIFDLTSTPFKEYSVTLLPFPNTLTAGGNITNVTPLKGYFPTHYKFVNNLYEGLQRSFFKGSVQTNNTTPDGLPVVQTFTTNPNILRVADTGRASGEPILIVD